MGFKELIRTESELNQIADFLSQEIEGSKGNVISRYIRVIFDEVTFVDGQEESKQIHWQFNLNKEDIDKRIYAQKNVNDLFFLNLYEAAVARDLQLHRFNFHPKGIPLPSQEESFIESIPSGITMYDSELRKFTKEHKNTRITRTLTVEQRIIVNSKGGRVIQTIPFFGILYSHYDPIPTKRDISVVCTSEEEIKRLTSLINYLPDPTPDKRIKKSETFSEAFHELYKISGLKYRSLREAGIPRSALYDVIMLTGVPVHELGHNFEEPIRVSGFGESGAFKYGQKISNKDIILMDNPKQEIEGFRVLGFTYVDAYGRKREPRVHIKDGKVTGFLGSEYADPEKLKQHMGIKKSNFVGNASQDSDGMFPQARVSCTVLDGRSEDVDLEGKILIVPTEACNNLNEKTYIINAYEAYVVKNGRPERIIPLQITGETNHVLENIVLLKGKNYGVGICEKREPLYTHSNIKAQIPISHFVKTQLWRAQMVYPMPMYRWA